jgi:hypothetical protein
MVMVDIFWYLTLVVGSELPLLVKQSVHNCTWIEHRLPVMSLHWNNYQETPDGCGQVATGIAVFEFNDEDKVIRHYSLSDNDMVCVPNYLESMKVE